MEEAAVKNLEELLEIYNDLALLPLQSAAVNNYISEHLHDDAVALLGEGMEGWTEFDLLAVFT